MGASGPSGGGGGGNSASSNYQKQIKKTYNKEEEKKTKAREDARVNQYSGNKGKGKKKTTTTKTVNRVTNDGSDSKPKEITKAQIGTLSDPREKDDTAAKASLFRETGATKIKDIPMGATSIIKPFFQESSRKTRDYFKNEVLGKGAYTGTSLKNFESKSLTEQNQIYKEYIEGRSSGKLDAYGREIKSTTGGDKTDAEFQTPKATIMPVKPDTPTDEKNVSDILPVEDDKDDKYDLRKVKKKGRRKNILTSSKGVTQVSDDYSLGKPSLLGSV